MVISCWNRVLVESLVQVRRVVLSWGVSRLNIYPPSGADIRILIGDRHDMVSHI